MRSPAGPLTITAGSAGSLSCAASSRPDGRAPPSRGRRSPLPLFDLELGERLRPPGGGSFRRSPASGRYRGCGRRCRGTATGAPGGRRPRTRLPRGSSGWAQARSGELEAGPAGARVLLDERVDRVDLVVGTRAALEIVEDGDGVVGVRGPDVGALLLDATEDALDVVDAANLRRLRAALADRDRDDRARDPEHAKAEQYARDPGTQPATAL